MNLPGDRLIPIGSVISEAPALVDRLQASTPPLADDLTGLARLFHPLALPDHSLGIGDPISAFCLIIPPQCIETVTVLQPSDSAIQEAFHVLLRALTIGSTGAIYILPAKSLQPILVSLRRILNSRAPAYSSDPTLVQCPVVMLGDGRFPVCKAVLQARMTFATFYFVTHFLSAFGTGRETGLLLWTLTLVSLPFFQAGLTRLWAEIVVDFNLFFSGLPAVWGPDINSIEMIVPFLSFVAPLRSISTRRLALLGGSRDSILAEECAF
jgi:hypothetical protein